MKLLYTVLLTTTLLVFTNSTTTRAAIKDGIPQFLIYPGSEFLEEDPQEHLLTSDSIPTVVSWYKSKLETTGYTLVSQDNNYYWFSWKYPDDPGLGQEGREKDRGVALKYIKDGHTTTVLIHNWLLGWCNDGYGEAICEHDRDELSSKFKLPLEIYRFGDGRKGLIGIFSKVTIWIDSGIDETENLEPTPTPTPPPPPDNDQENPTRELLAHWKFDEGTGLIAYNSVKNGINGTLVNRPAWQIENQCVFGKCLKFGGKNDYVNVNIPYTYSGDEVTLSVWVKRTDASPNNYILTGSSGNKVGYLLTITDQGKPQFSINGGKCNGTATSPLTATADKTVSQNSWHNITVTLNKNKKLLSMFIDGNLTTTINISNAGDISCSQNNLKIGEGKGYIDDVKIYSYEQGAIQIKGNHIIQKIVSFVKSSFLLIRQ